MPGAAASHPLVPHPERGWLRFAARQLGDVLAGPFKLYFDGLEGRAVLPAHFDDAIDAGVGKPTEPLGPVFMRLESHMRSWPRWVRWGIATKQRQGSAARSRR